MMMHGDTAVGPTPRNATRRATADARGNSVLDVASDLTKRTADAIVAGLAKLRALKSRPVMDARRQPAKPPSAGPRTLAELNLVNAARWRGGVMQALDRRELAVACDAAHPAPIQSTADLNHYHANVYARDSEAEKAFNEESDDPGHNPYTQREVSQDERRESEHGGSGNRYAAAMSGIGSLEELNRFNREYYSPVARAAADRRTVDSGARGIRSMADMARYFRAYWARR